MKAGEKFQQTLDAGSAVLVEGTLLDTSGSPSKLAALPLFFSSNWLDGISDSEAQIGGCANTSGRFWGTFTLKNACKD